MLLLVTCSNKSRNMLWKKKGWCINALRTPLINFIKNLLDYFQYICTYIYLYALMPAINLKIILNNSNLKRNLELSSNIVVGVWQGTALDLGLLALSKYMSYKFAFTFELNLTVHLASLPALRKMTLFILKGFQTWNKYHLGITKMISMNKKFGM